VAARGTTLADGLLDDIKRLCGFVGTARKAQNPPENEYTVGQAHAGGAEERKAAEDVLPEGVDCAGAPRTLDQCTDESSTPQSDTVGSSGGPEVDASHEGSTDVVPSCPMLPAANADAPAISVIDDLMRRAQAHIDKRELVISQTRSIPVLPSVVGQSVAPSTVTVSVARKLRVALGKVQKSFVMLAVCFQRQLPPTNQSGSQQWMLQQGDCIGTIERREKRSGIRLRVPLLCHNRTQGCPKPRGLGKKCSTHGHSAHTSSTL
jgi:hypothetical protein